MMTVLKTRKRDLPINATGCGIFTFPEFGGEKGSAEPD